MAHDQEKFYNNAELENSEGVQPNLDEHAEEQHEEAFDEVNDMKYFLELLRHIRAVINAGTNLPLSNNKKIIDAGRCLMIIDDLERNLPDAIQYGLQMYSERDRIMGNAEQKAMNAVSSAEVRATAMQENAREEAEQRLMEAENEARAILADAQERADHMVSESEIIRRAREEARIIKNDARVEASEVKLKATHEAYQLLTAVEEELTGAFNVVRRRRAELEGDAE